MTNLEQLQSKIVSREEILSIVSELKVNNKSIVFSNGCFDLVHRGHVEYLAKASDLADVFVLGLNTDASVQRLKGEDRPLQDEVARAILMAGFSFIDYVVLFDEDTPYELIDVVQPNVLVKGNDYKVEEVVGYDIVQKNGGTVQTIELTAGYSTTNIVNKIVKSL
jgi:rfaE bifunctional protein nucleotidyltransferase chain/domain